MSKMRDIFTENERHILFRPIIKELSSVYINYPHTVSQKEAANILLISKSKIYRLNKKGVIPYKRTISGNVHHMDILLCDVINFKAFHMIYYSPLFDDLAFIYLSKALEDLPDILKVKDISLNLGIGKNAINKWIAKGYLSSFCCKNQVFVTKENLIRYLSTTHFRGSHKAITLRQSLISSLETILKEYLDEHKEEFVWNKNDY